MRSISTRRGTATLAAVTLATTLLALTTGQATGVGAGTSPDTGADLRGATGPGAASGADQASPFTLWAPRRLETTVERGRERVWVDLGVRAVAGSEPFEVRSHRLAWDKPITTTWTAGAVQGTVPAGLQRTFSGLTNFMRVDYRDKSGRLVERRRVDACLNNGGERARPDAPATTPYPWGCPWNPYTLGSVQGIQAGWAAPISTEMRPVKLGAGRFTVNISVNPRWADAFGLDAADRSLTTTLVVGRSKRPRESHSEPVMHSGRDAGAPPAGRLHPASVEPVSPSAGAVEGPKPDLRSLPAFGIELNNKSTHLRFAATVWNAGDSPLVVDGFRRGDEDVMDAYQYFFDTEGEQVGYQKVGEMEFHRANHQHWHFQDFARYRLLNADKTPAVTSGKVSFCLANTDAVDYTVPGAEWRPDGTDLGTACGDPGSLAVREVLSSGSGDTYAQFRAGQAFKIEGLPNGWYWIAVEANPSGRLIEQQQDNNVSLRRIHLGGEPGARTVRVPQLGLIEEEEGFM